MSELRNRMIQDMKLAGLVEGTRREYLRAVRQLAACYMISPDRFAGLKFFYLNTLSYEWPLLTKKKSASHARSGCPTSVATRIAAA